MIFSLVLLIIGLAFLLKGYSKGLCIVLIISLTNDLFKIPFSFSLSIHHTLALIYSPVVFRYIIKNTFTAKRVISPLIYEVLYLLILALIFGFLIPWRSDYDYLRTWTQLAEGRALIQIIRLYADLSLFFLVYYLLVTEKLSFVFLLKAFAVIVSLTVIVAIINYFVGNSIKLFFFPEVARDLYDRFTGLNNEPRSFGRACSIAALFLLAFYRNTASKLLRAGLLLSFIGVTLSFSASAYLMTLVWILVFAMLTRKFKLIVAIVPFLVFFFLLVSKSEIYQNETQRKLEKVLSSQPAGKSNISDRIDAIEPELFTRFEVFDRAALNFLYRHPFYAVVGTGPNLISIPASPYLSKSAKAIYGNTIDSVPHSLFINILARSGLIGLFLWFLLIRRMLNFTSEERKPFILCLMFATMIVNNPLFLLFLGIILFFAETDTETLVS